MVTRSPSGHIDTVTGTFAYHGGTITTRDSGANCTNQQYLVAGTLKDVATTTATGGTGTFEAVLIHFRTSFLGRCVIYAARVVGHATVAY